MKIRVPIFSAAGITLAIGIVVCVCYAFFFTGSKLGSANSIADVQLVGRWLPKDLPLRGIRFRAYAAEGNVLVRADSDKKDLDAILLHWKRVGIEMNYIPYKRGFRYQGGVVEEEFRPDGDQMHVVQGFIPQSRREFWLYFKPGTEDFGVLYMHLLW